MNDRKSRMNTIKAIISNSYGVIATRRSPVMFEKMTQDEKNSVLKPYNSMIDEDLRMIELIMDEEQSIATGKVFGRFMNAEGVDQDMIIQIMEQDSLEPGDLPVGGL